MNRLSGGRRASSHQKSWVKLCRATDKYFASSVNGDVTSDPESRRVVQRFLKSLLDERDRDLQMINLLDKYLHDIAAVGEINDVFGKFPNQPKPLPFAYSNAWWVFDEVTLDAAFRYDIFMAEAEEIGYKRGKGNRYQLRRMTCFVATILMTF